jgi:hypothetical protein
VLLNAGIDRRNRDNIGGHGTNQIGKIEICCTSRFMPRNSDGGSGVVDDAACQCLLWGRRMDATVAVSAGIVLRLSKESFRLFILGGIVS